MLNIQLLLFLVAEYRYQDAASLRVLPLRAFRRVLVPKVGAMTSSTVNPYTLQVAIEREGVKSFKSMLQCLDRFGKELFLEANEREVGGDRTQQQRPAYAHALPFLLAPAVTALGYLTLVAARMRLRHACR